MFDVTRPTDVPPHDCVAVVHVGHRRRDATDDRIVALVDALPGPAVAVVYTSDAGLRARVRALGVRVAGARTLLDEPAALRHEVQGHDGFQPCPFTRRLEPLVLVARAVPEVRFVRVAASRSPTLACRFLPALFARVAGCCASIG